MIPLDDIIRALAIIRNREQERLDDPMQGARFVLCSDGSGHIESGRTTALAGSKTHQSWGVMDAFKLEKFLQDTMASGRGDLETRLRAAEQQLADIRKKFEEQKL